VMRATIRAEKKVVGKEDIEEEEEEEDEEEEEETEEEVDTGTDENRGC